MMIPSRLLYIRALLQGHAKIKIRNEAIKRNSLLTVTLQDGIQKLSKCSYRLPTPVLQKNFNVVKSNDFIRLDTINSPWSAISQRSFWGVLNVIFNKYDESRVKAVGPDRACAEWLLRCGASVKWKDRGSWTKDYNSLPTTGGKKLNKIEEVDATDSAVMHVGFKHFNGCKHLRRIVFHKASYLTDEALEELPVLKATLKELQITSCGNISADGLRHLKKLVNLEYILLYDFPKIKDKDSLLKELEEALPNCAIYFPYSLAKDDPSLKKNDQE